MPYSAPINNENTDISGGGSNGNLHRRSEEGIERNERFPLKKQRKH
jgi:hypothetical protein